MRRISPMMVVNSESNRGHIPYGRYSWDFLPGATTEPTVFSLIIMLGVRCAWMVQKCLKVHKTLWFKKDKKFS